ncbi:hypothetical protein PpBr36_05453 [Pyricularia pennisetigena]|uniref:hypothetical protein n=1 Tax=Pyricularia pennisetigena TaxID=1578925 RepID=UPI00115138FD|nr:hypothetical protein PpBr36_05453 [Pyricularia pennisetigena]TLS26663.1 hypothetical protein PpBr36_05453 [Pyricularia pennisetigena]
MHTLQELRSGACKGLPKLKLTCRLDDFPPEILSLGQDLVHLDLSGTGISSLPSDIGAQLPNLKILFLSNCNFTNFPSALASCPSLSMVAFRDNSMTSIPENSLPPKLRWLILTNNKITALPKSIGSCGQLEKCMLAGNFLTALPDEMAGCQKLTLLRLSANRIDQLPDWLFHLPNLAFLSFAGNPCTESARTTSRARRNSDSLPRIRWSDLTTHEVLGEGASGIISKATWRRDGSEEDVAVKLFRGSLTSDGTPVDEMRACMSAGAHANLVDVLGRIHGHPDEGRSTRAGGFQGGLVMQLIPPTYRTLGKPPSLDSCTRDCYDASDPPLSAETAVKILAGVAAATRHLHSNGIYHGDLYAHNIMVDDEARALLGDMGAATIYGDDGRFPLLEGLEVLAFAHLVDDVGGLMRDSDSESAGEVLERLKGLHRQCSVSQVADRPSFGSILETLQGLLVLLQG